MKKKVLFVIDSLEIAGAEKSLVTLLSLLDFNKFEVDLRLFSHGSHLENLLPRDVNLLPPLSYTHYTDQSLLESVMYSLKYREYKMLIARLKYSAEIRKRNYKNSQKARIYWNAANKVIEEEDCLYDIAVSYAQGIPTFYVADKVKAKKKYAWVNVSYHLKDKDQLFQRSFYDKFEKIVAVSCSAKEVFLQTFPEMKEKLKVIYDINDPEMITSMAEMGSSYQDNFKGIRILTIGRLANQKGYDMAIEACKKLKESGLNFKWYVLGKGPLEKEIIKMIEDNDLKENFILLGVNSNPYPFIKDADIYVQTSRFEGFGLAIAEARMLNVPVVTTRFDAVYNQMIHGNNGLVVDMDGHSIYKGIMKFIKEPLLKEQIVENLKKEKKGNTEELEKFYHLIS
ncbi:glycosyltransferase [Halobacillus trueperi]|uniref:glycosyltransferase n=1 Tax=Halobacillus trueperi TaxID=156205 RepID=UPI003735A58A